MNNKQFLDELGKCLLKLGANERETSEQVQKMDAYLRSKGIENVDFVPERIAAGMMPRIRSERFEKKESAVKTEKAEKAEKTERTENTEKTAPQLSARPVQPASQVKPSEPAKPVKDEKSALPANDVKVYRASERREQQPARQLAAEAHQRPPKAQTPARSIEDEISPKGDQNFDDVDNRKQAPKISGSRNFWILFGITLPFAIALSAAEVALFVILSIALAILSIALFAVIVAITAAGGVVSLIGIIYGAYQIIKGLVPIGLFEIGLGITVGASVMLAGVIMYNIAVRFVPFAIKQMFKLTKLYFSAVRDIFYYAKRRM